MSVCTAIEKVSGYNNTDLLQVTIDHNIVAYWFYDYADSLQFLDKEVIVDYRDDMYNGEIRRFIKTFVLPTVVNTLDKQEGFKLYIDQEDNQSNTSFNEIQLSETKYGCIVFCSKQEIKSSNNASWVELTIRDKFMRCAKLRLFDPETQDSFEGSYIHCDLSRNQFGFNTKSIVSVGGEMAANKEISVAEQYIKNMFADDMIATDYLNKTMLLKLLAEHVDYEKGYAVVRLAMELAMADALHNVTKDVDVTAICHALLCRYGHYTRSSILSEQVNNIFIAQQFMFPNRKCVVLCLDTTNTERPDEAKIYQHIIDTVDSVLRIRKGVLD